MRVAEVACENVFKPELMLEFYEPWTYRKASTVRLTNMRAFTTLLAIGSFAVSALADGAAIVHCLNTITGATANLNNTVLEFYYAEIGLLELLPVVSAQETLLNDVKDGTKTAQASADLSNLESIAVYGATQALVAAVNQTLTTLELAKPKFDGLLLVSPIILQDLQTDKKASDQLSAAIISKVPTELQAFAQQAVAPLDAKFLEAITVYGQSSLL
ncbi:Antigenic cell wall [Teratosphaeria destructans]|uniref:Antigenic cell wall n=1 Tax=Teratosphaeria destructans TaxID=418781 RepID=A0A9W7SI44_9PEZI|nr:Antigenic cell wall [Teratosphaeria destructans]